MLPQIDDFRAEADALHDVLLTLKDADWRRPTRFKQWTTDDIVRHLHESDLMAAASIAGTDALASFRAEREALISRGMTRIEAARIRLDDLSGADLRQRWHARAIELCEQLSALPLDARLPWVGPDMGVRMFTTARQMETWAHGQAIHDLFGIPRESTDRLRNIAEIGVRTYGWTFANRRLPPPGAAPFVRLTAPSGSIWQWNHPDPTNMVDGSALEFCQVVTQTRNVADTNLRVSGEPALTWMRIAQCFAGPPEEPPAKGTRTAA